MRSLESKIALLLGFHPKSAAIEQHLSALFQNGNVTYDCWESDEWMVKNEVEQYVHSTQIVPDICGVNVNGISEQMRAQLIDKVLSHKLKMEECKQVHRNRMEENEQRLAERRLCLEELKIREKQLEHVRRQEEEELKHKLRVDHLRVENEIAAATHKRKLEEHALLLKPKKRDNTVLDVVWARRPQEKTNIEIQEVREQIWSIVVNTGNRKVLWPGISIRDRSHKELAFKARCKAAHRKIYADILADKIF